MSPRAKRNTKKKVKAKHGHKTTKKMTGGSSKARTKVLTKGAKSKPVTPKKKRAPAPSPTPPQEISATVQAQTASITAATANSTASSTASSTGGSAMKTTETTTSGPSSSFKNFRHHTDMENFYRFIYDNDLRFEALKIVDMIIAEKKARRLLKTQKSKAH